MKKLIFLSAAMLLMMAMTGCKNNSTNNADGKCHIVGTISKDYDGIRVFLVPLTGPQTAKEVDSIEIKDGKFEFYPDSLMLAKILLDYHYRVKLQTLLVITEPGTVEVTIDSISHGKGTPQNDSLEKWKNISAEYNTKMGNIRREMMMLKERGVKVENSELKANYDSLLMAFKTITRNMAKEVKEEPLHSFLDERFPLTYKRQMPDGRTVTMNADTNEEISE